MPLTASDRVAVTELESAGELFTAINRRAWILDIIAEITVNVEINGKKEKRRIIPLSVANVGEKQLPFTCLISDSYDRQTIWTVCKGTYDTESETAWLKPNPGHIILV